MPAAMKYSPDDKALREEASNELKARRAASTTAWKYYLGQHKKPLRKGNDGVDDNTIINLCRQLVDRVVAFRVPKFPDLELDELDDTEAERELKLMWQASGGPSLLAEIVKTGAVDGHVFARVLEPRAGDRYPRVISLDPANVLVWWQADDYRTVLWYEVRWSAGGVEYRQDIVNEGSRWAIYQFRRRAEQAGFVSQDEKWAVDGLPVAWDYALGPIVDVPHIVMPKQYYGAGELGHAGLNDSVNKARSDISKILRFHASPRTVGTGFKAGELTETAIESFWTIEDEAAKVYNLEMQSDLTSSRNHAEDLRSEFFAEGRVVIMRGDIKDFQRVTDFGVRALYTDQLAKNEELGWGYAGLIEGVSQRLRMLAGAGDFEAPVIVKWPDPLPRDPLEQVQVLEKEQGMGVASKETIAEDLGRNWTQEQERMAEEGASGQANQTQGRVSDPPLQMAQADMMQGNGNGT